MPNVIWSELEGKPWKLDVGSSMEEALQSKDNSTLHVTTDGQIVMNGVVLCNGVYATLIYPDKLFSLTKYSSQKDIFEAFSLHIDGHGDKTMATADDVGNLLLFIYQYGFKVLCDNEQASFLQVAFEETTKAVVFNISIERNINGNTYKSCVRIKGESDGKGDANLTVLSSYKKRKINEPKLSEPDFKVCVRKALPMHPRKGMKYYFDNGVKYNLPKKAAFDNGFTFTVPKDGNTWVVCGFKGDKSDKIVPNGTVIDKNNLLKYFPSAGEVEGIYTVITRKTNEPVLITIVKDMESVFKKGTFKEACAPRISCDCRKKYRRIVDGKVRYDIPIPDLRKGESVFDSKYAIFKYRWKRVKYYGENPPEGMKLNDRKTIIIDGKEKKSYRMIRSDRKGTVYVARQIPLRKVGRKGRHRYILSPKVKCFVDENLKIIKRL